METIILCAGRINYTNLPIQTNTSNSMVPVNGKPVIGWILDDLLVYNPDEKIVIVVRDEDDLIQEFLNRVYVHRANLSIVTLTKSKNILHSLRAGLKNVQSNGIRLILGDTLVKSGAGQSEADFVFVQEVDDSSRWCLAKLDDQQHIEYYIEKQSNIPNPHYALCGYYVFSNAPYLLQKLDEAMRLEKRQLSDVLGLYQAKFPMQAFFTDEWYDFGNADNFFHAKQRLLQGRFFNTLTVDPVLHTITKISELDVKLRNELNWYENLPHPLQVLTPRIIDKQEQGGKLLLTQEYYGYPMLSELYLYSNLTMESWGSIFKTLFNIHAKLKEYKSSLPANDFHDMYSKKTEDRLAAVKALSPAWKALTEADKIVLNGTVYHGLPFFEQYLMVAIEKLVESGEATILHGDFCFSNILYDINGHIVRLIDPRGSFGTVGIYGDPRYDVAKLRHSVSGKYDYLVSDLFSLVEIGSQFTLDVFFRSDALRIDELFDTILQQNGYILAEIKLIEALLFLSMVPYHSDKPLRQKAMFLTGIKLLNELQHANSN